MAIPARLRSSHTAVHLGDLSRRLVDIRRAEHEQASSGDRRVAIRRPRHQLRHEVRHHHTGPRLHDTHLVLIGDDIGLCHGNQACPCDGSTIIFCSIRSACMFCSARFSVLVPPSIFGAVQTSSRFIARPECTSIPLKEAWGRSRRDMRSGVAIAHEHRSHMISA